MARGKKALRSEETALRLEFRVVLSDASDAPSIQPIPQVNNTSAGVAN